jgi:hypothetical protein
MGGIRHIAGLILLCCGCTLIAQQAPPVASESPLRKRALELYRSAIQPLGTSLFTTRDALNEAWEKEGDRLSAAELEQLGSTVPLNYEELAILDGKGRILTSLPADAPLGINRIKAFNQVVTDTAATGRTFIQEDRQAAEVGRFHVLIPLQRPARKDADQAAFMYAYMVPFALFSQGLSDIGLQEGERMYFFRDNGELLFKSAESFGGMADLRIRNNSRSLRALFHRVLEEPEGTGDYTGFGFARAELATHEIYWLLQGFMMDKWIIVYDRSRSYSPAARDGPLTGVWEVSPKKTPGEIPFLIYLIQEGPFCFLRANGKLHSFTAEARYLNDQMASTRLAQARYDGGKLFNLAATYLAERDELRLNLYLHAPQIRIDQYLMRRINLHPSKPEPETMEPLPTFSARKTRETASLLLQEAEEDLSMIARFIQVHPDNASRESLYNRMLQRYPKNTGALYLRRADLHLKQVRGSNLDAATFARRFEESMGIMEQSREALILDIQGALGEYQLLVLVPVWSADRRVVGMVGLLIPASTFFGMLTEILPDAFTGELMVLDRKGKVLHTERVIKQQAQLIRETLNHLTGQAELTEFDAELGRNVDLTCDWDTLEARDLNWKFIALHGRPATPEPINQAQGLTGRWKGRYQIYSAAGKRSTQDGEIECFISQHGAEVEILTSQEQVLHKFKGVLENGALLAWTSSFIRENGRSEYLAAKLKNGGQTISGTIYFENGETMEEHWFKVSASPDE